jgi:exosortase/archaeosortase family protein
MMPFFRSRWVPVAALMLAFWPVWRWYVLRMADGSDEKLGLVALVTLAVLAVAKARQGEACRLPLPAAAVLVGLYALTYPWLPPLARAVIAVSTAGLFVSALAFGRAFRPAVWGLLLLALPVTASMQYYLGYPMRVAAGRASAWLVGLTGVSVTARGTCLRWMGETVAVDAPCSGVHMLWAGAWLSFTLACLYGLPAMRTFALAAFSAVAVLAGNAVRAAVLFYKEAGLVHWPAWAHEGVGVVVFAATALVILGGVRAMKGGVPCAPDPSS